MTMYRNGRMSKMKKIEKALERAHNMDEAFELLDCSQFKLTWSEINQIVHSWHKEQVILSRHGEGAYVAPKIMN